MFRRSADLHRDLRAQLLSPLIQLGIIGGIGYLVLGFSSILDSAIFPVDGLFVLVTSIACFFMMRFGYIFQAANWFIVGLMWAVAFNVPFYGINHPVTALYLPVIVVSGLLIGGYFQIGMFILSGMLIPIWGYQELTDEQVMTIQSSGELVGSIAFWWATMAITAGFVWLFARHLENATLSARSQTNALAQTMQMLTQTDDVTAFQKEVIRVIADQLAVDDITLLWMDDERERVHGKFYYLHGTVYTEADMRDPMRSFSAGQSQMWQHIMQTPHAFAVNDVSTETKLRYRARLMAQGVRAILYVPLFADDVCVGALSINRHEQRSFSSEEILLAESLSQQIMLMMTISRLTSSNRQHAVAQERNRMAQEIHDSLAQGFTGIIAQLEAAQDMVEDDPDESIDHMQRAQHLARHSLQEARRSVMALRPRLLEEQSLPDALRVLVQQMDYGEVAFEAQIEAELPTLRPDVEHHLLRIAQEGLQNAVRHSQAQKINLQLLSASEKLRLVIRDDGVGFAPDHLNSGFGLVSMAQRAESIDAQLQIESVPNGGTQIQVEVIL